MCGRYKLVAPTGRVFDEFSLTSRRLNLQPRYNLAPTQDAPVVRLGPTGRQISLIRWGLVPGWATRFGAGQINARAETVADKPTFRDAVRARRCLVVADGFYEWKREGRDKVPYLFEANEGAPFAFAGLYERWDREGPPVESFTIICTAANALVGEIHDRMPVILPKAHWDAWLDTAANAPAEVLPLLAPYPADAMKARRVNKRLNAAATDDPAVLDPEPPELRLF